MGNAQTSSDSIWSSPNSVFSSSNNQRTVSDVQPASNQVTETVSKGYMQDNRDQTISAKVNDKTVTVHPNNEGYLPMHKFSGVEACYLTCDRGHIMIHGSRGGEIALKCDKRGRYHMNFDNGVAVFPTQRHY